ncbi:Uncharacterised protein [Yersinia pekkanenii]|uniref:Uncharacterized protein n=1 Tax=Yersinia pekkanenii TaxID=1288385 RepID=A0A0T9R2C6_9GAMM|nr:Uncharacterised protein [Yersinia pekkanenii]CRY69038.1 Uncharacterised protein [Yersinia pekkanenii]
MIAAQISGNLHPFTRGAVTVQRGVIQLGLALDFNTGAGVGGAVDGAASDGPIQLHPITVGGFAAHAAIAFIG